MCTISSWIESAWRTLSAVKFSLVSKDKIQENFKTVVDQIIKLKPDASKGQYLRTVAISLTMGPGIKIDPLLANTFVSK